MKKISTIFLVSFAFASAAYAGDPGRAVQEISKQRDIADYNCKNNLPNRYAAEGFCRKRDALQTKLDRMGQNQSSNDSYHNQRYDRDHDRDRDRDRYNNRSHDNKKRYNRNNNRHHHSHHNNHNNRYDRR
ncbi:hypothetical protein [Commensalibacter oyaizuii]|uniref:Uncharacterized protein n=1 Tax=Commensalibacter oyaizuii TaxID=3043873 RepID=A0ABT6PYQ0_9PROT|nr:hypothetical protein [Commensalibacter sp. TBRC 16381]MDI2089986.1 hypothetical protein [Commensalibacter sp. TBRC 16381]